MSIEVIRCSFCHKTNENCFKLVANPSDYPDRTYICDECMGVCFQIVADSSALAYKLAIEEENHMIILLADRTVKANEARVRLIVDQGRLDTFEEEMKRQKASNAKPNEAETPAGGNG